MADCIANLIEKCGFVRETSEDLYSMISQKEEVAEVINKIIPNKNPRTELFNLSVYLYGFSPSKRKYGYDFFFFCNKLYELSVKFKRNENEKEELFTFSYKYDPVTDGDFINPCHFVFCVRDSSGNELPRQAEKESIQKRNKALVNLIFEEYLCKAVCFDTNLLQKWDTEKNALLKPFASTIN